MKSLNDMKFDILLGDSQAAYEVGMMYLHGRDTKKNLTEAKKYFELAAEKNHIEAKWKLIELIEDVDKKCEACDSFLKHLDEQKISDVDKKIYHQKICGIILSAKDESDLTVEEIRQLVICYSNGYGVEKNLFKADILKAKADFIENQRNKAIRNNDIYKLICMYMKKGPEQNLHEAEKLLNLYYEKFYGHRDYFADIHKLCEDLAQAYYDKGKFFMDKAQRYKDAIKTTRGNFY